MTSDFLTHFERTNFLESPNYDETMKYFAQFESTGKAEMFSFGVSPQGRELKFIVVGNDRDFSQQAARANGKVVVLIQNGIHAGEMEGKDACMLMVREMLIENKLSHLLDNCVLLIIPIVNVDGHERTSPFNRPNQNGPKSMGWRTTSWNLNLNRDYMKADAPEMKALLQLYTSWQPDFYIDNHTTNGADYQYHITYGIETHQNIAAGLAAWAKEQL
ncbi:MAG: M14 family zinc carboxypeptidase, partial [Bacteroidota bacterium]